MTQAQTPTARERFCIKLRQRVGKWRVTSGRHDWRTARQFGDRVTCGLLLLNQYIHMKQYQAPKLPRLQKSTLPRLQKSTLARLQ